MADPFAAPGVKATANCPFVAVIESIVGAAGVWATNTPVVTGAVKVSGVRLFPAKSEIDPEFKFNVVDTSIPSVSTSLEFAVTVYLNVAVLESVRATKVALRLVDPIVMGICGCPVTVTDSLNVVVKFKFALLEGV
jgi:hypothetical protein